MAMAARTLGQTKTTPFYLILSTPVAKSSACGPQSRQKKDFYTEFCLLPHPNPPHADPKVDKKRTLYRILSTPASKSANRDPESRQKQRLSPNFCLLPRLNPSAADHKVDKKRTVLTNFVYYRIQIRPARLLSRTKSPKIEKMFYHRLQIRLARTPK